MPELPEVETVRGGLEKLIVGKQVLSVECLCEKSLPVSLADVRQIIVGATIMAVRRRAKMLIIDLTGDYSLLVHLKMTGQMVYRGEEDWGGGHPNDSFLNNLPDRSTRVVFHLSDGNTLFFNDQRKFGWIKLYRTDEIDSFADESLWLAGIHPATKVDQLSEEDLRRLLDGIQKSMSDSLAAGGSTARNYVKADGTRGDYLDKFAAVYKRQDQPCKRCGHDIIKTRAAGRGTHYCPHCQPMR